MQTIFVKAISAFLIQPFYGPLGVLRSHPLGWSQAKRQTGPQSLPQALFPYSAPLCVLYVSLTVFGGTVME